MSQPTSDDKFNRLQRDKYPMPDFIEKALVKSNLMKVYQNRPAYQQNDYIGWITRAKKQTTVNKRLEQMLSELQQGGIYMNMPHKSSK